MTDEEHAADTATFTPLMRALAEACNLQSAENGSNTPDFILGRYLHGCLKSFAGSVKDTKPGLGGSPHTPLVKHIEMALASHPRELTEGIYLGAAATFLAGCLDAFDVAVRRREDWYGRNPEAGPAGVVSPPREIGHHTV